jgi:hypothetical protein
MYEAKLINKVENPDGTITVTVEYSDGVDTVTESFVPQDKRGYEYRVQQRKESLTTAKLLKNEDNVGKPIVTEKPLTAAEQARNLWLERDALNERVQYAIDRGYLTGTEPKVVALRKWLKDNFKPEYIGIV